MLLADFITWISLFSLFRDLGILSLPFRWIHAVRDGLASHGSCLHLIWERWESRSWDGNSAVPHFSSQIQEKTHFWHLLETTSHFQGKKIKQFHRSLAEPGCTGFNWALLEGAHPARYKPPSAAGRWHVEQARRGQPPSSGPGMPRDFQKCGA